MNLEEFNQLWKLKQDNTPKELLHKKWRPQEPFEKESLTKEEQKQDYSQTILNSVPQKRSKLPTYYKF